MRVYFLRHGAAEEAASGQSDADRRLTKKGTKQMKVVAAGMDRIGVRPDVILTSPLARARETAEIAAAALGLTDRMHEAPELACGCTLSGLSRLLAKHGNPESVMVVGHEPDFSTMVGQFTGGGAVDMKKAGLALVEAEGIAPGRGCLLWLLTPTHLEAAAGK
jgi:phosphohistidine phosphatase